MTSIARESTVRSRPCVRCFLKRLPKHSGNGSSLPRNLDVSAAAFAVFCPFVKLNSLVPEFLREGNHHIENPLRLDCRFGPHRPHHFGLQPSSQRTASAAAAPHGHRRFCYRWK